MTTGATAEDLRQAYRHCQEVTKREARNFYFAFITLPVKRRRAIYAVYAFCRLADDIADGDGSTEDKAMGLAELRSRLDQALDGAQEGPVFAALADAVETYNIPHELFHEVISGVEMDLTPRRYADFEELEGYCYRVASAVGLICLEVFGYTDTRARKTAVELGFAMQLTNIMRDLQEDFEAGRVYLPQDELRRFGYTEAELGLGTINDNYLALMRFQAARARGYFESGGALLSLLSPRSRACPAILHGLYSRVLDRMEKQGFDVFHGRVSLPTSEKLRLTATVWATSLLPHFKMQ